MHYKSYRSATSRFSSFLAAAAVSLSSTLVAHAAQTSLAWDASSSPDIAGYKIHYGPSSKSYNKVLNVGKSTQATVADLTGPATYFFAVTAYNSAGVESAYSNEVSAQVVEQPNQAPVVRVTSPSQGSSFVRRTRVSLTATASDSDGSIAKVEFYAGRTKIGEDRSAPYSVAWTPSQAGAYTLTARATDNCGAVSSSAAVSVAITNGRGGRTAPTTFTTLIDSPEPNAPYAGALTLTTTAAGTYSGKVKYDGVTYEVKGRLDAEGKATKKIARKGKPALVLNLESTDANGGELSGSITDGTTPTEFNAKKAAGKSDLSTLNAGRWTVLLPPVEGASDGASHPSGTSFATVMINKQGVFRLTGALADGTPIAQGGRLEEDGALSVYIPLYGKKGILAGSVKLPISDADPKALTGSLGWHKPQVVNKQKPYSGGFDLALDVVGDFNPAETKPGSNQPPRTGSAKELTLSGGNLTAPIQKRITIKPNGKVEAIPGPEKVRIEIRKNGKFTGSFLDPLTSKRRGFVGMSLPTQGVGAGYFLGKEATGGVILEPTE